MFTDIEIQRAAKLYVISQCRRSAVAGAEILSLYRGAGFDSCAEVEKSPRSSLAASLELEHGFARLSPQPQTIHSAS